jgi:acetyl esterase/lipase
MGGVAKALLRLALTIGLACGAAPVLAWQGNGAIPPPTFSFDRIPYGAHGQGHVALLKPRHGERPPIVIQLPVYPYIAWVGRYSTAWLPSLLFDHGYVYAAINPRSRERVGGKAFVAELAAAIAETLRHADQFGFDPGRVVLVGQGWGGHSGALLATDPSYLEAAGVPFGAVKAVVILDGAGLDLVGSEAAASDFRRKQIARFADKESRSALSPLSHAAPPNAPRFLIHALASDREGQTFAAALTDAGTRADVVPVSQTRSKMTRTHLGAPSNRQSRPLLRFLEEAVR